MSESSVSETSLLTQTQNNHIRYCVCSSRIFHPNILNRSHNFSPIPLLYVHLRTHSHKLIHLLQIVSAFYVLFNTTCGITRNNIIGVNTTYVFANHYVLSAPWTESQRDPYLRMLWCLLILSRGVVNASNDLSAYLPRIDCYFLKHARSRDQRRRQRCLARARSINLCWSKLMIIISKSALTLLQTCAVSRQKTYPCESLDCKSHRECLCKCKKRHS